MFIRCYTQTLWEKTQNHNRNRKVLEDSFTSYGEKIKKGSWNPNLLVVAWFLECNLVLLCVLMIMIMIIMLTMHEGNPFFLVVSLRG